MNGRIESEIKLDRRTEKKLKDFPSFVYEWYLNLKASRTTATTRNDYINKVCKFLKYVNNDVKNLRCSDITQSLVTQYYISIQTKKNGNQIVYTSDSYQNTIWSCLYNFFEYLKTMNYISQNYIETINKPSNHDLDRINEKRPKITKEDMSNILSSMPKYQSNDALLKRDRAILMLLMATGMRRGALINIEVEDIDFDQHILVVIDKGNRRHCYPLVDKNAGETDKSKYLLENSIKDWILVREKFNRKANNHLFISNQGTTLSGTSIYNIVEKYCTPVIGVNIAPHKLRGGYCSILYNETGNIELVRRAVGHANVSTTQRYITTKGEEKQVAAHIMAGVFNNAHSNIQ